MKRNDDFESRRGHLADMSDQQLKDYFWQLSEKIVQPMLEMGYKNTSPAIERSVLLRMGFSSLEVKPIVDTAIEKNLIAHGAGNIVYKLAKAKSMSIRDAGLALAEGKLWDEAKAIFVEVQLES